MIQLSCPWLNSEMSLFLIPPDGEPVYSLYIAITSLEWTDKQKVVGECRFCGGRNTTDALKCVHCGAALDSENIGSRLCLEAKLPGGRPALELVNGSVLEILHKPCKDREVYNSEEVVIRLTVRKTIQKTFDDLVVFDPSMMDEVRSFVVLACEMELLNSWDSK